MLAGLSCYVSPTQKQGAYQLATGHSGSTSKGISMAIVALQGDNPVRDSSLTRGPPLAVTRCLEQGDDK